VQDCARVPQRAHPELAVTPSSSRVSHALNPCRARRRFAATREWHAEPGQMGFSPIPCSLNISRKPAQTSGFSYYSAPSSGRSR
jgi:hypothetical protein